MIQKFLSRTRNYLVRLLAQSLNGCGDNIARLQIRRRSLTQTDARWRAGQDHITRLQAHEPADVRDQFADRADHVARRTALLRRAVDAKAHRKFLRIGDLVARCEKRPERRKGVGALALEALPTTIELELTFGEINADAITKHMVQGIALTDVGAGFSDHHRKLDLPVDTLCLARHDKIVGGPASRAGRLQEKRRLFRQQQARFFGVFGIVQADADDLAGASQRRTENGALRCFRQNLRRYRSDGFDIVEGRRARIERRKAARQIEDLSVQYETGLLAGCRTITDKLHGLYNIRGSCKTASRAIVPKETRV